MKMETSDFAKKKVIVGRKLKKKSNDKISVKSKHIKVPIQNIRNFDNDSIDNDDDAVMRLIKQLSNPSATTREFCLEEIKKRMKNNSSTSISLVFPSITECLYDEESKVRKCLIELFKSILPQIPSENLVTVFPVVITYITG